MKASQPQQPQPPVQAKQPQQAQQPVQASQPRQPEQRTVTKAVIDLQPGDVLMGKQGGHSIIEESSDHSGLLGFMRIETEHGHLYMEMDSEVKVLAPNQ